MESCGLVLDGEVKKWELCLAYCFPPLWNPAVLKTPSQILTQKRMSNLISHWQQCQSFDIPTIITSISGESCLEVLTSFEKLPAGTDESFFKKLWLSKDSGNNSSVLKAMMEDRVGEGEWVFLDQPCCCLQGEFLTPGLLASPKQCSLLQNHLKGLTSSGP